MPVTLTSLVLEYLSRNPSYVAIYMVALVMGPVKELVLPHLFGQIVKTLQAGGNVMALFSWVIMVWVVVQVVLTFIEWNDVHFYPAMMDFLRAKIMDHVFDVQRENFDDMKTYETIAKLIKLPLLIYGFLDMWKRTFIPQIVMFCFALVYIGMHDIQAAVVVGLITAIISAFVLAGPKQCEDVSQGRDAAANALNEDTEDVLRNMMAVLNAVNEKAEQSTLKRTHDTYVDLCKSTMMCAIGMQARILPLQVLFMGFMVWRCYMLSHQDLGRAVSLLLITMSLSSGLTRVFAETRDLILKWGMVKESMTVFDYPPTVNHYTCRNLQQQQPAAQLELRNVTFSYKNSTQPVLEDVSLSLHHQQRLLILGRIGSGKSTLLKLIMRYKRQTRGELLLDGVPYCHLGVEDVRRRIGYVPQVPSLFNRTIFDNIVYGSEARGITPADVEDMLRQLGLDHMFDNLDYGILSPVGKNGSRLSGGQRQVVWILRVLLQEPEILLLDEPTASIDAATKDIIYSLLDRLMTGRTVIMVTHDEYLLHHSDRVIQLGEHGKILYDGPPQHMKTKKALV